MAIRTAGWQGHSRFYVPGKRVRAIAASYMHVSVTMTEMPFYTVDRINIPLRNSSSFRIGDHQSDTLGFIAVTPPKMELVTTEGEIEYWCIDLFRGMVSRLLNMNMTSLKVPYIPVGDYNWLEELGDRLRALDDDDDRIEATDAAIGSQLRKMDTANEFEAALFHIHASSASISAQELADRIGVNRRKLERIFKSRIGSSPLREIVMARTFQALETLVHGEAVPWRQQDNAAFTDQSHFIRHTRQLTGSTPGALAGKYIWQTNAWYSEAGAASTPNSDDIYDAWQEHFANRIDCLAEAAGVSREALPEGTPAPFRPTGPAPDYPLNPWSLL